MRHDRQMPGKIWVGNMNRPRRTTADSCLRGPALSVLIQHGGITHAIRPGIELGLAGVEPANLPVPITIRLRPACRQGNGDDLTGCSAVELSPAIKKHLLRFYAMELVGLEPTTRLVTVNHRPASRFFRPDKKRRRSALPLSYGPSEPRQKTKWELIFHRDNPFLRPGCIPGETGRQ